MTKRILLFITAMILSIGMMSTVSLAAQSNNDLAATIDLSKGSYTIETAGKYIVSAYEGVNTLTVKADADVTLQGVNVTAAADTSAINIESGNVTINVTADSTLKGGDNGAGIYVAEGASLTVKGGKLTAIGNAGADDASGAAGIGGTWAKGNSGAVTIDGATVDAYGYGVHGSGIGSGSGKVVGEIKIINNANVTAYGGYYANGNGTKLQSDYGKSDPEGGAGIGGGAKTVSTIANITISDSAVTAYGGSKAAGIGANFWSSCGTITISGNSDITAQGGSSSAGIGTSRAGDNGVSANIVISGGKVTATGGDYGAGIGGGYNNDSLGNKADTSALPEINITISDGEIYAYGGEGGAGIGGGYKTDNIDIDIVGGAVTAKAGALVSGKTVENGGSASAIGTGANGSGKFENSPAVVLGNEAEVDVTSYYGGKPAIHGYVNTELDEDIELTEIGKPVAKIGETEYATLAKAVTAAKDGDVIVITQSGTYELPSFGKELTIKASDGIEVTIDNIGAKGLSGAKATFENLTFDYYPNKNYTGLQHIDTAVYNNCTFNGQVFLYGNSEIFNGCTFNQNSADAYNVWTYGAAKVEFNECIFSCEGKSVLVYNEGARATELTVTDTDFIANTAVDGKAAIEIDTSSPNKPGAMDGTIITIDEKTTAVGFDRGSVSGERLWNDKKTLENLEVWVDNVKVWPRYTAKVGDTEYVTLAKAVAAANAVDGGATVELIGNSTLGEKLTITGDITISGEYTITRADDYTGTLFAVNAGATLTLDGGVTIDGGNEYVFDAELYSADLADWETSIPSAESTKWFTPEEGAPVATAYMITVKGDDSVVNLNDVSIKNHYSTNGSGIVSAGTGATVNLDGAQITHNASTNGSGLVVNASGGVWSRENELITVTMNEGTVIDGNHVGGNHGIFKIYMGTYFTMNGGEIKNTTGWNSNGTAIGIYHAVFTMNGGTICSNSSVYGPSNGRNAAIYGHSNHLFVMNDGTICHNTGRSKAGVDSPYSEIGYTGSTTINGGTIVNNEILGTWTNPDVNGGATLTINGGTFTQDVNEWCANGLEAVYHEETGLYTIERYYTAEINGVKYYTIQDAINAVKSGTASGTIKVIRDHCVDVNNGLYGYPILVNAVDITLDLNGHTVTFDYETWTGNTIYTSIGIYNGGTLTVLDSSEAQTGTLYNKHSISAAPRIIWVTSACSLVVESGNFISEQADTMFYTSNSNANIPTTLYIKGGNFVHTVGNPDGAIDFFNQQDNYKEQYIELSGGIFNNDPKAGRQNDWEVTIAPNYQIIDIGDGRWTVGKIGNISVRFANTTFFPKVIPSATALVEVKEPKKDGYVFAGWYANAALTKEFDLNTVLYDDTTIYAKWKKDTEPFIDYWYILQLKLQNQQFEITANAAEGGKITPEGISKVKYGKGITYTITPDEGYAIADIVVDGESVGAVSEYTFERVKEAHTITASFKELEWANPFVDVSKEAWYYGDIEYVYENDLMLGTGDNVFSPNEIVNRAMLVTVLWRLEGSPVVESSVAFTDVPAGEWYTDAVNWASANGIVNGYGDGTFGPTNDLTHEQIMAILNRYAVYKKWSENLVGDASDSYTNNPWAENNVLWAEVNGMFDGIGSDISNLTKSADRAELAAYLRRFCEKFITE